MKYVNLDWFRIRLSARRMGLRDKGPLGLRYRDPLHDIMPPLFSMPDCYLACALCRTRQRVGICKEDSRMVEYCWRCERVTKNSVREEDGSGGGGQKLKKPVVAKKSTKQERPPVSDDPMKNEDNPHVYKM